MPRRIKFSSVALVALLWEWLTFPYNPVAWALCMGILKYLGLQNFKSHFGPAIPERNNAIVTALITNLKVQLWEKFADEFVS
jgi:hypothetical protein